MIKSELTSCKLTFFIDQDVESTEYIQYLDIRHIEMEKLWFQLIFFLSSTLLFPYGSGILIPKDPRS